MPWYWVDYSIVGVIGLSMATGLFRGFIKELVALCAWILAIGLALMYSPALQPKFQPYIHDKTACLVFAFIAILLATILLGGLVNALLSFILRRSGLSSSDRILGMGFGLARGVFIVALMMLVVKVTTASHEDYTQKSRLYAKFDPLVNWLYGYTPDLLKQIKNFEQKEISNV